MYAMSSAIALSRHRRKYAYFVSLHTSTRIESYYIPVRGSLDFDSLMIKS
jgi:hypothetical protein